jgi:hypothetical protein
MHFLASQKKEKKLGMNTNKNLPLCSEMNEFDQLLLSSCKNGRSVKNFHSFPSFTLIFYCNLND